MGRLSIFITAATAAALAIGAFIVWPARDYLLAPPSASDRAATAAAMARRSARSEVQRQDVTPAVENGSPDAPTAPTLAGLELRESSEETPAALLDEHSAASQDERPAVRRDTSISTSADPEDRARQELLAALEQWVVATNSHDIDSQMEFYPATMEAFYLRRNISRAAVRAEKQRVFEQARLIDVRVEAPYIALHDNQREATMRFRRQYEIEGGRATRRGEVLQELRWVRQEDGWKIISERDLQVLR